MILLCTVKNEMPRTSSRNGKLFWPNQHGYLIPFSKYGRPTNLSGGTTGRTKPMLMRWDQERKVLRRKTDNISQMET
ncbi:CNT_HP2_G0048770.mRNA.1.CDS.1 [Saccharomyces cerevisiae]|nr:CNT_HP2_G0048770.mRNA.1.CDS.1 [Saccharomyces cerevisiae]CAI6782775.1 CNT_HP2_G0048770.mRNA.1.CDS.1 [Saccharomyces cerevisiae]